MEGYIFDYRLGYVREGCMLQGFDVLGGDDAADGRIVALGGYTTPEMAKSGHSWADALYARLGGDTQIISGCTDGYATAQMLTSLIRDVLLLRPKSVVCLSGFYNIAYRLGLVQNRDDAAFLSLHPFATPGHLYFYRKITARFGLGNDEVYYGEENHLAAWELWLRQFREMSALCDAFGIGFKAVLQPCVFSGAYQRSELENANLRTYYGLDDAGIDDYHEQFQREYAKITQHAKELDGVVDLSGVFDGCRNVYLDACHVKSEFLPGLVEGYV